MTVLSPSAKFQRAASNLAAIAERFPFQAEKRVYQREFAGFAGDANLNEIGITSWLFPTENALNGKTALLKRLDTQAVFPGLK